MKKLYLAGGCFWCISDYFLMQDGVEDVTCGYSGGQERNATYKEVKSQKTGHRETVEVIYDESIVSLDKLLDYYFNYVDVTDDEGQSIDRGHSYSLALYYQNDEEKALFEKRKEKTSQELNKTIHLAIEPFNFFIPAEKEHQYFSLNNPEQFEEELIASNRLEHLEQKKK